MSNWQADSQASDVDEAVHPEQTLLGSVPLFWNPGGTLDDESDPPVIATTVEPPSAPTGAGGLSL
jgi:hypothetical protein